MTDENSGRDNKGRFIKDRSGNTKGRPKKAPRAFLPMQHEIDFLKAMEKGVGIVGPDGERSERPAVLVLMERAITAAIKDPEPKTIMALLDRYLRILEKNRLDYLQEEDALKRLRSQMSRASGEKLSELKRLDAYLKWKTRRH